jgi:precorrin-6B methylase 2
MIIMELRRSGTLLANFAKVETAADLTAAFSKRILKILKEKNKPVVNVTNAF